jgi:DNA polymerase-1
VRTRIAAPDAVAYVLDRAAYDGDFDAAFAALLGPEVEKTGHGVKDIQRRVLVRRHARGWRFDTALAAYLLDATAGNYELSRLCERYCGFTP